MKIALSSHALPTIDADLLALGVKTDHLKKDSNAVAVDKATGGALFRLAEADGFKGSTGETLVLTAPSGMRALRVVVVGLGGGSVTDRDARALAVKAAQLASKSTSVAVVAPAGNAAALRGLAEGLLAGAYRYTKYLTGDRKPKKQLATATIVVDKRTAANKGAAAALKDAHVVADAMNLVRDLVNAPPNDLGPPELADAAKHAATGVAGLTCEIFDEKAIAKKNMTLLLAVARGSSKKPRVVHLKYVPKGKKPKKRVVFVGKGLTFDSGGLCIKPAKSMGDMKCDMTGGALTIAVVVAAAKLGLPIEVHGLVGAVENMPDGDAYRPGDVWPSLDGKTVEIINTDAEGRLVLADVLAYGRALEPDYMIDHATLTGACIVALGSYRAGLFASSDELARRYEAAAHDAGEMYWRMPLDEDLRDQLKSDVADLKHTGDGGAGSVTAALFLKEFVGKTKWMHLDIAGPAFAERPHGIYPKGGTGFGVMTAVRFLERL